MPHLNNTAALAQQSVKDDKGCSYESVSVRPIENGFVVTKTCDEDGKYTSSECFSPTRPKLGELTKPAPQASSMSKAIKALR